MNPDYHHEQYHDSCYKEYSKYDVDDICKEWFEETVDQSNRYRDGQNKNTKNTDQTEEIKRLRDLVKRAWADGYEQHGADEFATEVTQFKDTDIAKELDNESK